MGRGWPLPVLAVLVVLAGGCGRRQRAQDVFPPGIDPELASILLAGDDSLLVRYGYEKGVGRLDHASELLHSAVPLDSEAAYRAALERLDPYRERIYRCLAEAFHTPGPLRSYRIKRAYTYREALLDARLYRDWLKLDRDPDLPPREKLHRAQALLREAESLDPRSWQAGAFDMEIARAYDEMGRPEDELAAYRRSLAREGDGAALGDLGRRIGTVGFVLNKVHQPDSARVYYERAREVALRMRHPGEAVFALRLLTSVARSEGHLARAYELVMESQEVAREFHADFKEWDALRPAIETNRSLGAWKIVGDLLLRTEQLARDYKDAAPPSILSQLRTYIRQNRGTLLMATGHVDEGSRLFAGIQDSVRGQSEREHYAVFLADWGQGLLDAGRGKQALPILAEGCLYCRRENLPSERTKLLPLYAQALLEGGDVKAAATQLAAFRNLAQGGLLAYRNQWIRHDATAIRLASLGGDPVAEDHAVRVALSRLESILDHLDGSESAYLFLDSCRDLRSTLHDLLADDPVADYGLELYWRLLYRKLGRSGESAAGRTIVPAQAFAGSATFDEFMIRLAERAQRRLRARGAVHCLYLIGSAGVVRWKADGRHIEREVLDAAGDTLRHDVQRAIRGLSGSPAGAGVDPDLAGLLARLGRELLPEPWIASGGPRSVLITPDGYLGAFPFETLNMAGNHGEYRPLLDRTDVAYLRYDAAPPAPVRVEEEGLVVAEPARSRDFTRRYPTLGALPQARAEAAAVMARSPGSRLLAGREATRTAITARWESVRFLYIASHFVRDAEVPYLVFLPLAPEPEGEEGAAGSSYLDLGEIRNASLGNCSLVVLSGCASGVPYSDVARSGPGLGDAFLDAGAGSVIQTFWRVDDRDSADLMRAWAERWADGDTPLQALDEVRREALHRGEPPQVWAAYGIELAGL